jgi:hypothetical protein
MERFLELVACGKIALTFGRASNAVWMPCISRDIGVSRVTSVTTLLPMIGSDWRVAHILRL